MAASVGLSAPEAFVLLSLPKYNLPQTLKLAFIGLLAQGALRIDEERHPGLLRTRRITHLRVAPQPPAALSPLGAVLVGIVRAAGPGGLMKDVVNQSRREFGNGYARLVSSYVYPALAGQGLAESRKARVLGLLPVTRFHRTPAGDAEKRRIEGVLRDARDIPRFLDRDPAQAAALVAAAGAAILLVEELRPHYQALSAALRPHDGGTFSPDAGFDNGGFDFGGIDFSSFDTGAFDSFDAGFSDAGGDSGGDGGDGGSSGC